MPHQRRNEKGWSPEAECSGQAASSPPTQGRGTARARRRRGKAERSSTCDGDMEATKRTIDASADVYSIMRKLLFTRGTCQRAPVRALEAQQSWTAAKAHHVLTSSRACPGGCLSYSTIILYSACQSIGGIKKVAHIYMLSTRDVLSANSPLPSVV